MSTKRLSWLLLGACGLLTLTGSWSANARAASSTTGSTGGTSGQIDVSFFYDTLKDDGSWFNTTEYGDVWQPYIAYKSESWRPYTDGYWSYTDGGWMFVSNETFGWAVYHYGRWTKLQDIGWAWVPGTEWAPAWVTWRESKPDGANGTPAADTPVSATTTATDATQPPPPPAPTSPAEDRPRSSPPVSESYIGWAPLPPEPIAYGTDYSYGPTVDVDFGIDPYAYVFTDYRSFGSPWIAGVIFDPDRGYYCCDHSVNITNVYYNNRGGGYRGFYNGGPDFNRFRGVTERPIPQLALQRTTSAALVRQQIRSGQFNRVNGNQLAVAAPRFSQANVRNGRVNFTRRGTLPVTPVARELAPASAANNAAYKQARESFAKQGENYRTRNPNAPGARRNAPAVAPSANPGEAPRIATTPRARREERQARQAVERQGATAAPAGGREPRRSASVPPGGSDAVASAEQRHAARQNSRRESRRASGGGAERAAVREQRQPTAPRAERQAPRIERGGGGGERRGGGGGERRGGGGGGGHPKAEGGGGKKKGEGH